MTLQNNNISKIIKFYQTEGLTNTALRLISDLFLISSKQLTSLSYYLQNVNIINSKDNAILMRNNIFNNCHKNRRCFVIGNGPSLKTQDLSYLKNELTFVVSGFYKHPIVEQWQPNYYCFADAVFYDGSEQVRKFFLDLSDHIYSSIFFMPLQGRKIFLENYHLPIERTYFTLFKGELGKRLVRFPDLRKAIPGVQGVSQMPIMMAMYMGCSPIYLLGMDHDWLAQRGMDRHFYKETTVHGHPVAHGNLDAYSYESELIAVLNLWKGYNNLKKVANQHNIQIINATNGGFLDVYPRVKYETLFDLPAVL